MQNKPRFDLRPGITEPIILMISRQAIESGDVTSIVEGLDPLLEDREVAWRSRGQMILTIEGYDDDPRELVDIPGVREFLRELDQKWPFWVYFFNQVDTTITLYLSCLCGLRYPGGGVVEIDLEKLGAVLRRGFEAINGVFETYDFPESELEVISRGLLEVLEQAGVMP